MNVKKQKNVAKVTFHGVYLVIFKSFRVEGTELKKTFVIWRLFLDSWRFRIVFGCHFEASKGEVYR